jgi:hypothetical protein
MDLRWKTMVSADRSAAACFRAGGVLLETATADSSSTSAQTAADL